MPIREQVTEVGLSKFELHVTRFAISMGSVYFVGGLTVVSQRLHRIEGGTALGADKNRLVSILVLSANINSKN